MRVLLPCAGESRRFRGGIPKAFRTMWDGRPMFAHAADHWARPPHQIVVGTRKAYYDECSVGDMIDQHLPPNAVLQIVDGTTSQVATLCEMIRGVGMQDDEPFVAKDADCTSRWPFTMGPMPATWMGVARREAMPNAEGQTFGMVQFDPPGDDGVPGPLTYAEQGGKPTGWIVAGSYGFASVSQFLAYSTDGDTIVDVFAKMIAAGVHVTPIRFVEHEDWGTLEAFVAARRRRRVLFVDLDGVIVKSGTPYTTSPKWWEGCYLLPGAAEALRAERAAGNQIVVTTTRSEEWRERTESLLFWHKVPFDKLLMGLYHAPRVLVNDYAEDTGWPMAWGVNVERDAGGWARHLPPAGFAGDTPLRIEFAHAPAEGGTVPHYPGQCGSKPAWFGIPPTPAQAHMLPGGGAACVEPGPVPPSGSCWVGPGIMPGATGGDEEDDE